MQEDPYAAIATKTNAPPPSTLSLLRHPIDNWQELGSRAIDTAENTAGNVVNAEKKAFGNTYPVRVGKLMYHTFTGQRQPGEGEGIAEDALRDFALAGAGAPEMEGEAPAARIARPPAPTGPRSLWGVPRGAQSAGLGELPVRPPVATPESLGRVPVATERPIARPMNVRGPGEIAPEMPRPRAFYGGPKPEPIPPRSGLQLSGEVEAPSRIETTPKHVGEVLDNSLNASPLKGNVSLRNQIPRAEPVSQSKAESSVIREHRYDPEARELHVTTKSNPPVTYVYGDVDADQAGIMQNATSKGKAWAEFKKGGSPLVAKIVNGQRIPVRPVIAAGDLENADVRIARPNEDLTPILKKSVARARASKGIAAD